MIVIYSVLASKGSTNKLFQPTCLAREAVVDLVSGSVGGVANVVVGQPMDTVKVLLLLLTILFMHPCKLKGQLSKFLTTCYNLL